MNQSLTAWCTVGLNNLISHYEFSLMKKLISIMLDQYHKFMLWLTFKPI
jgi:hypothetical protein